MSFNTLILSGGSVKCISTLGALQYCYDKVLVQQIDTYIGTSAGGIIAYLLVIGYTPVEILIYLCTNKVFHEILNLTLSGTYGMFEFLQIQEHLEKMTINKTGKLFTFQEIKSTFKKSLILTTYNLSTNCTEYLSSELTPNMSCIFALKQSAAMPFLFPAVKYMGNLYVDGAMYENFPVTLVEGDASKRCLGIAIDFYSDVDSKLPDECSITEYIYKILVIPMRYNYIQRRNQDNVEVIELRPTISMFDFSLKPKEIMDLFSIGYHQAKIHFEVENEPL